MKLIFLMYITFSLPMSLLNIYIISAINKETLKSAFTQKFNDSSCFKIFEQSACYYMINTRVLSFTDVLT